MVVAVADRAPSEPCRAGRWRRGVPREGGKTCLIDEGGGCSVGGVRVVIVVISFFSFLSQLLFLLLPSLHSSPPLCLFLHLHIRASSSCSISQGL